MGTSLDSRLGGWGAIGMDIQDPQDIELSDETRSLLREVLAAKERLDAVRPFSPEVLVRLRRSLLPERIVATLNMEGIAATRRQTLLVMDAMRVRETPGRDQQEIVNALRADELVHDVVEQRLEFSEQIPRELNAILLTDIREDAGAYRNAPVELPGAPQAPPSAYDVPDLMRQLSTFFPAADTCDPILQAAWIHAQFTMIHPFSDGNGRTGRLLQDYALIRRGFLPVGIPTSKRDDYYEALAAADQSNWNGLVQILGELQLTTIGHAERIAREPAERSLWIKQLSGAAARKERETQHRQYVVWKHRVGGIVEEFRQVVSELGELSSAIGARARVYDVATFDSWREMCQRGQVPRSWLLDVSFLASGQVFYRSIFFLRRHESLPAELFQEQRDTIGIYVTGVDPRGGAQPTFRRYDDPHIRLRELVFVENNLYVFSRGAAAQPWECRDDLSTSEALREFFEDMFYRKAGLRL